MPRTPASNRPTALSTQPLTQPATQFVTVTLPVEESLPPPAWAVDDSTSAVRSTLSGALKEDVSRFLIGPQCSDPLPVLAASIRHSRPVAMQCTLDERSWHLVTLPRMQAYACDTDLHAVPDLRLHEVRVARIDEGTQAAMDISTFKRGMLSDLVWRMSLHGARDELLPEIAGPLAFRIVGQPERDAPSLPGLVPILRLLKGAPATLHELVRQGADPILTRRVLNALYLRSGLLTTRACAARPRNFGTPWR